VIASAMPQLSPHQQQLLRRAALSVPQAYRDTFVSDVIHRLGHEPSNLAVERAVNVALDAIATPFGGDAA
jgi:hypothetical protein